MILVTGGTGFVGANLLKQLLKTQNPPALRSLCRSGSSFSYFSEEEKNAIEWVEADLLDVVALAAAFEGVKKVFHCAALISFSPKMREAMFSVNVTGTANVVNLCLENKVQKLIHVSSIAAIGRQAKTIDVTEKVEWDNESPLNSAYAKSKFAGEMEVWRGHAEGLEVAIVNPSVIMGPIRWNEGTGKLFLQAEKNFPFYTKGATGFVDVSDVARAMRQLMESEISGERFILNGVNWSFQQMMTEISTAIGRTPPSRKVGKWMSALAWRWEALKGFFTRKEPLLTRETIQTAQRTFRYDSTKIKEQLNFEFTPMKATIACAAHSFLKENR